MSAYPAARYAVVDGELTEELIQGPDQERPGWEPTPHKFRALSIPELRSVGHSPEEAERLYQRELRRVAFIFAGKSIEEAETLADVEPEPEPDPAALSDALEQIWAILCPDCGPGDAAGIVAAVQELQSAIQGFNEKWAQLKADRDSLARENGRLKSKLAKAEPSTDTPNPAE